VTPFDFQPPTPLELMDAPEIASLTLLDACLRTAERALLAAHPELCDLDDVIATDRAWLKIYAADAIVQHIGGLTTLLERYRRVLALDDWHITPPCNDDDLPF
jgi:hypothetical protein